jgi:hypothetical protein
LPAEQQRIGQILQKDTDLIKCLVLLEHTPPDDPSCVEKLKDTSLDYRVRSLAVATPFELSKGETDYLAKIDTDYLEHEVQYQQDRSSEVARFNVPLLGIASDRSWLWMVNMVLGPLFYFLIRDSLTNVKYMLSNLYENSIDQPIRLLLLSVTQIISSAPQKSDFHENRSGPATASYVAKFIVMCLIFTLPLLVSGLLLYDWYYFSVIQADSTFFKEPEFIGGFLTVPVFIFEVALFLQICGLISILFRLHNRIRGS